MRSVWGIIAAAALLLVACSPQGTPQPGTAQPAPAESGGEPAGAPDEGDAAPAAPGPAPLERIVLCTGPRPDVLFDGNATGDALLRLVVPQAVIYGVDYTAEPGLLTGLPNVAEGTLRREGDGSVLVTLRYRNDLVWSDGEPFDVADAVAGLQHPVSAGDVAPLAAAQDDAHTLTLALPADAPYPYVPAAPPLPSHVELDGDTVPDSARLGPALGPYVLAEDAGDTLVFAANPNAPDFVERVPQALVRFLAGPDAVLDALTAGDCDVSLDGALADTGLPDLLAEVDPAQVQVATAAGPVYDQLIFNTYTADTGRAPLFADARVRQAVARALNRRSAAALLGGDAVPEGVVLDSWLPANHWANPGAERLTVYPPDAAAGGALLDEAGWPDANGDGVRESAGEGGAYSCGRGDWRVDAGQPLVPELVIPEGDAFRQQLAERIQADLAAVGIAVTVTPVAPEVLYSADGPLARRTFDLALLAAVATPDPGGISRFVGAEVYLHPTELRAVRRGELEDRWLRTEQMVERLAYSNIPSAENGYEGQNYAGWCSDAADAALAQAQRVALGAATSCSS